MADINKQQTRTGDHVVHHGTGRYYLIWFLLLVGTAVTVATGRVDLGAANIFIAMGIATVKAALVVLFFMHLWDEGGVNRLVFVVSILFAAVLIIGVFGDLLTRRRITLPNLGPMPPGKIEPKQTTDGH